MLLDQPRQQRALVHVVKHGRELQRAGQVLDDLDVGGGGEFAEQFLVFQDEIAQAVGALLVELVAFHGGEHGAEDFRPEDVGKGVAAFAAEPEQQFAAGGVLVDEPGQRFLEQIPFALGDEQAGKFPAELGGHDIQRVAQDVLPASGLATLKDSSAR